MEITGDPPPLWPQLSNSMPRRRPQSSPLLSPPVLIILLPIIALILLFFAVPPFVSMATQIFRPYGVRRSWDSLNILLVLFAILCGVFARRNDEEDNNSNAGHGSGNVRSDNVKAAAGSQQWFEYPERKIYGDGGLRRLKRNSSSYPDLRQESLWENNEDRFRFFDDFEISKYRSSNYNHPVHELRRTRSEFSEESESKVIHVDKFVLRSSPSKSPAPSTPPPPPPPPPAARHKSRRTYQAVGQRENVIRSENDNKINSPPVTPPPPPPPPPRRPPSPLGQLQRSEQKHVKLERRKSNATKEIKMVFASLRKKKKKTKTKDQEYRQDCPLHSPREPTPYYSTTIPPPSPAPPPPPPPPPPPSVFQKYNLFKKSSKSKKIHSVPAPPPPPPPPAFSLAKQDTQIPPTPPPAPPPPFFSTKRFTWQKTRIPAPPEPPRMRTPTLTGKPPLPTKPNTSYYDENTDNGGQSPLIPMPPPPPPPPFKMPEFKFIPRGDFVKIGSSPSSRCSSPDLEETDASSSKDENIDTETASMDADVDGVGVGVAGPVPVFCPSPDVNAKAETFIARLKDGWKLEKINSLKEKRRLTA